MSDAVETVTLTVEAPDGTSDDLTVPAALLDALADGDDAPQVVADVALMGLAQRAHALVHHAEGDVGEDLAAAEERTLELFEERFGITYGEATGHSH